MTTYPDIDAGARITSQLLDSMLPIVAVKSVAEGRTNNTLTIDSELQFEGEAGATYFVEFCLMAAAILLADFMTEWTVPADASGFKSVLGPGSAASNGSADNIAMRSGVHNFDTNIEYSGVRNDNQLGFGVREIGVVILSSAGTVGINWAQVTTNATAARLFGGSYLIARRAA